MPSSSRLVTVRLLRCLQCGKTIECQPADLMRYMTTKWPRCCGEVMTYFAPSKPPTKVAKG
ncbi:MAG TPA: hypothetical protein VH120_20920 [Gemmataceae bacterium]|jgi:phage FluMu protein Com|nr:hypothetical protein [Gemmataceae bacterium]